ncbi:HET-domain-containing protein [Lophiostoma macrostomum CBS 122681]|uniref:HET-domain-containing protein n=1 Tax=Lophiostoma macrostomum CBS 122681 TaxID=1314788 RepID=A0A6A6TB31_9PLEO|nr:HET-domain-containing protein [Lophiostoma macrostomum CBS 122681]
MRPSWKGPGYSFTRPQTQCLVCRGLHLKTTQGSKVHHSSIDDTSRLVRIDAFDLAESADAGDCLWCSLVYRSMIQLGAELPEPEMAGRVTVVSSHGEPFHVEWAASRQRIAAEIFQVAALTRHDERLTIPELGQALDIGPDIMTDKTFDLITDWIAQCDQSHEDCKISGSPSLAPKRLIDVGDPLQLAHEHLIKLVENVAGPVAYVALSHCWGLHQGFTTTIATLRDRQKNIEWVELPKTFQDSIFVTRKLGLRYLWIDSLCIVQDDDADWSAESVKMHNIYEHSYLTVAAAVAKGDDVGFLQTSEERARYDSFLVDLSDFGKGETVRVREIHDYRTTRTKHILDSRAWTLQEVLIPPRLLTFSVTVFFECRQGNACECGSGAFPDPFCAPIRSFDKPDRAAYGTFIRGELNRTELYGYWKSTIVREYSQRELTRPNDYLPALNAMIRKFRTISDDTCIAGIWQGEDLPCQLGWYSLRTGQPSLPMPQRGPTWSWISIDGPVLFMVYKRYNPLASINITQPVRLIESSVDITPTGLMRSGALTLSGNACWGFLEFKIYSDDGEPMCRLRREGYDKSTSCFPTTESSCVIRMDTAIRLDSVDATVNGQMATLQRANLRQHAEEVPPTRVLCLLLGQWGVDMSDGEHKDRCFLLLTPAIDKQDAYHRIGIFDITYQSEVLGERAKIWFEDLGSMTLTLE